MCLPTLPVAYSASMIIKINAYTNTVNNACRHNYLPLEGDDDVSNIEDGETDTEGDDDVSDVEEGEDKADTKDDDVSDIEDGEDKADTEGDGDMSDIGEDKADTEGDCDMSDIEDA